jgi:hypothetical protein
MLCPPPMHRRPPLSQAPQILLVALVALAAACKAKIGDPCKVSTDCSIRGERTCDLSYTIGGEGECIIEGCTLGTCPKEAVCVKIYGTDFLSVACDPEREDTAVPDPSSECTPESCPGLPPLDDCQSNEVCLPEGLCVDDITARTSCRLECDDSGDCRTGYRCQRTGQLGIYRAPDPDAPTSTKQTKICVPDP